MSLNNIINNLDFDATPSQFIYDQYGQPIEVRYVGNHTDPQTQLSYFAYATNERTPILVPQPLAPHQYPVFHPQPYQDDYPADHMESPRPLSPRPQRQRTSRQESARQRRRTQRVVRRELRQNPDNIFLNQQAHPRNIFLNQEPIQRMPRPASPVRLRQQPPNPASKRSLRKASRQQRDERAARIASGWIYGGKTRIRH
jgi:hypothetical protein